MTSALSGFVEAGVLAIIAEAATSLVTGAHRMNVTVGPLHTDATVGTLLAVAATLAGARLLLQMPLSSLPARISAGVAARLRNELFAAFNAASWAVQSRDREGHFQELMTNQVAEATHGALQMSGLISFTLVFLSLVVSALALNVVAAAVVLATALLLFGVLRPVNAWGHRTAGRLSTAEMQYAAGVSEAVRVAEETHVFGAADAQRLRVGALIASAQELFFRTQFIGRLVPSLYQSLVYFVIVGGLAGLYTAGSGHVASLGAVVLLLVRAGSYGQQLQGSYQFLRQALPYFERLQDVIRRYAESNPSTGRRRLQKVNTLAWAEVSYQYQPGRLVLAEIDFEVRGGETIGIVGPSGAGKSTLLQIILRLRTPTSGRYLINGILAQTVAGADWHRRVAYVPQEPRLLHATVADNIRYFRDLSSDALEHAARLARIHDDIVSWGQGYDTVIGPRADAVSGGQRQRICLARALAARPEVLVLDEPTSQLDPHSEMLIRESLRSLVGHATIFIAAHRMSTLDMCGRVMVILDGRLEAFDSIASLQRANAYYRSAVALGGGGRHDAVTRLS